MGWLLAGYYGLVLINISGALRIRQLPRVVAVKTKQTVHITCPTTANTVQWYRLNKYDEDLSKAAEVNKGGKTDISTPGTMLTISNMRVEDTGVYFCKVNDTWGSGTELRIARRGNRAKFQYRTQMKDGLIILQALLLAVCTGALMLRRQALPEKRDSIYEEPEDEHIYEGLSTHIGGDLYEELCDYAQPEGAEAPWE